MVDTSVETLDKTAKNVSFPKTKETNPKHILSLKKQELEINAAKILGAFKKLITNESPVELEGEHDELQALNNQLILAGQEAEEVLLSEEYPNPTIPRDVETQKNLELPEQQSAENSQLEEQVLKLEKELGVETQMDRIIEACLYIDYKFLRTGLIADYEHIERLFGEKQWLSWLKARKYLKNNSKQLLNLDFIQNIHRLLSEQSNPDDAGTIRHISIQGGDYVNLGRPTVFTKDQIKEVNSNPYLEFVHMNDSVVTDPDAGVIMYVTVSFDKAKNTLSQEAKDVLEKDNKTETLLRLIGEDISNWYNAERKKPDYDPLRTAALLQRKIVSAHLFEDKNGALSRALMYWSLENDDINPSIIEESNNDILIPESDWVGEVKKGTQKYDEARKRIKVLKEIGYDDPAEALGLSEDKTFYQYIHRHVQQAPTQPAQGDLINHDLYAKFLKGLDRNKRQFEEDFTADRFLFHPQDHPIKQGGLIPESYVNLITLKPKDAFNFDNYIRNRFYDDSLTLYRGGLTYEPLGEEEIIRMFEEPVNLAASYKALAAGSGVATSAYPTPRETVVRALETYNQLISAFFMRWKYPQYASKAYPVEGKDFYQVVGIHTLGTENLSSSPFVSTSINRTTAESWAIPANNRANIYNPQAGVLIESMSPTNGGIFTFGRTGGYYSDISGLSSLMFNVPSEEEMMVVGAIIPQSIKKITIFSPDASKYYPNPSFTAERIIAEGEDQFLIIQHFPRLGTGDEIKNEKTYILNRKTGKYELFPFTKASPLHMGNEDGLIEE